MITLRIVFKHKWSMIQQEDVMGRPTFGASEANAISQTLLVLINSVGNADGNGAKLVAASLDIARAIISVAISFRLCRLSGYKYDI